MTFRYGRIVNKIVNVRMLNKGNRNTSKTTNNNNAESENLDVNSENNITSTTNNSRLSTSSSNTIDCIAGCGHVQYA